VPELLNHLFALVCGQNPDHTWAPGGLLLPCCQRCTGLYAGAFVAAWLQGWLRPKLTGRFLEIHGLFLLVMVPFGFHWLPQDSIVRTISGALFGFGVLTFLWLPLERGLDPHAHEGSPGIVAPIRTSAFRSWGYGLGLVATLALLPSLAAFGGETAAYALAALALGGGVVLLALVVANAALGLAGAWRFLAPASGP
jgi:uncharacterized membrane protein